MTSLIWRLLKKAAWAASSRHFLLRRLLLLVSAIRWLMRHRSATRTVRLRPDETMIVTVVSDAGGGR